MRRTWCWCQTLHGLLMYLMLTLSEERGSSESPTDLQFLFISHLTREKLPKSWMSEYLVCEMWDAVSDSPAAQHRSSPANAKPVHLELRNQMQCSNVIPAVSSELISLAERQDRFCLGRLHRQSSYRVWYLSQFICSNTEVLSVLRKSYWFKWCHTTLFVRSVASMTYAEGCI